MTSSPRLGLVALGLTAIALGLWTMWFREVPARPEAATDRSLAPEAAAERTGEPSAHVQEPEHEMGRTVLQRAPDDRFFRGRVQTREETPIANATLTFHPGASDTAWRERAPIATGTTDPEGRFEIEARASPGVEAVVRVEAEGFWPVNQRPVRTGRELRITLRRAARLRGRILDASTYAPIAGATIVSHHADDVVSDGAGTFDLPLLVGSQAWLSVLEEGYVQKEERFLVESSEPLEMDILLEPGLPFSVEVFDQVTGAPVAGARVRNRGFDVATTDADGRFGLHLVDGTDIALTVTAEGYCELSWSSAIADVTAASGARIPMREPAWIEGRVTDASGAPLEGVPPHAQNEEHSFGEIELSAEEKRELSLPGYARYEAPETYESTDEEGSFQLAVVPSNAPYYVTTSAGDFARHLAGPVTLREPGDRVWLEIALSVGATIRGRVIYNSEPWRDGSVCWRQEAPVWVGNCADVEEDGAYELKGIPAGEIEVLLRGDTDTPRRARLSVETGGTYEQDFVWEQTLATIRGQVVRVDGTPVQDVSVRAWCVTSSGSHRSFQARTGADGAFSLAVAPGHEYEMSARLDASHVFESGVPAGAENVELVLRASGVLRLKLVDARTGAPVRRRGHGSWDFSWRNADMDAFRGVRAEIDAEGIARLELARGEVDLRVQLAQAGYAPRTLTGLVVTAEEDREPIRVELARGSELKLELADHETFLTHAPGHLLFVLEEAQLSDLRGPYPRQGGPSNNRINGVDMWVGDACLLNQLVHFDEAGAVFLRGLAPGRYSLRAFPDDLVLTPASFEVEGSDTTSVRLEWALK